MSNRISSSASGRSEPSSMRPATASIKFARSPPSCIAQPTWALPSGSFATEGMMVIPCSMRTLAAIANGYGEHFVHRAADVVLKERRRLVLVARGMPLSEVHLENMLELARIGVTIMPLMPAFYNHPKSVEQIVDIVVARVLDQFGISAPFAKRWEGRTQNLAKDSASEPKPNSCVEQD